MKKDTLKIILYIALIIAMIGAFIGFSVISFAGLSYWFGTVYAIKCLTTTYILIAIIQVVIYFVEKKIKSKKQDKE